MKTKLAHLFICLVAFPVLAVSPSGRIEVGVAAYTFRRLTALEAIEKTKECGGEVIEFFFWQRLSPEQPKVVTDMNLADEHIAALRAKLKATGVRAVNAYFNNTPFKDKDGVEAGVRKMFEFARKLGLRGLTGEPPVEHLDLIEKFVKEYDIQLCFHNHPKDPKRPHYRNWDPAYLASLMQKRDRRMGFCVDTGHLSRSGIDPVEAIKLLGPRVLSLHLKDVREAQYGSPDVPYGQGVGNITGVLAELKRQGFRGHIAVEYEQITDHLLDDVKHCVKFIRTHLQ
ncbi:MAG: sugar phosphate isomerase/epimerase [Verrucomicrobiae bacterium]|nr:sugar phosphate isomerase/epimerase [Verrucomicrobiae bacterium]